MENPLTEPSSSKSFHRLVARQSGTQMSQGSDPLTSRIPVRTVVATESGCDRRPGSSSRRSDRLGACSLPT